MVCIKCGEPVSDNAKFCEHCGTQLLGIDDAPPSSGPVPIPTVSFTPKKKKSSVFKIILLGILVVVILLFLVSFFGSNPADQKAEQNNLISDTKNTIEEDDTPAQPGSSADNSSVSDETSIETAIFMIEASLVDSFENVRVSYEDGIIYVNIWNDGASVGAMLAAAGDEDCLDAWNQLVSKQEELCKKMYELVQALGIENTSVVLNILNDVNLDNVLLTVMNGYTFYDFVNDQ